MKKENMAMLCDFYEFTMSNGYFKNGFYKKNVYFDVFFRSVPDDGGYAIGAFNVNNMEIVQGITEACQEEHAPVILQVSKGARAYANHTYLVKLVKAAVALSLIHI